MKVMVENEIKTTKSLWSKCDSMLETVHCLQSDLDYAKLGLYNNLHELLGLILTRLNENDDALFELKLDGNPFGGEVKSVLMHHNGDGIIWFDCEGSVSGRSDDEIDVEALAKIVKWLKEKYDM